MRRRLSHNPVQCIIHKRRRECVNQVWLREVHSRENGPRKSYAFQDARRRFEIVLSIATRTARHVRLIGRHHFNGRRQHDGFADCRRQGNRNGNERGQDRANLRHALSFALFDTRDNFDGVAGRNDGESQRRPIGMCAGREAYKIECEAPCARLASG